MRGAAAGRDVEGAVGAAQGHPLDAGASGFWREVGNRVNLGVGRRRSGVGCQSSASLGRQRTWTLQRGPRAGTCGAQQ